jgi:hypothetical protein
MPWVMQPVMQPLAVTWQIAPHRFDGFWDDSVDSVDSVDTVDSVDSVDSVDNKSLAEFSDH